MYVFTFPIATNRAKSSFDVKIQLLCIYLLEMFIILSDIDMVYNHRHPHSFLKADDTSVTLARFNKWFKSLNKDETIKST